MKPIPGTLQRGGAAFQSTRGLWLPRARQTQSEISAQKALSNFCEAYWPPLYAVFCAIVDTRRPKRRILFKVFSAHLLEKNTLSRADKEKGRLRNISARLAAEFFVQRVRSGSQAQKRRRSSNVSMDEHLPKPKLNDGHCSSQRFAGYDLAWASNIGKRAWQHLQDAFEAEGKAESLEVLRPFVDGSGTDAAKSRRSGGETWSPRSDARTWLWRCVSVIAKR